MLLNKITGHKQNSNLLQFTYMYEIENKKINGKKKKIENTKKKNLSLSLSSNPTFWNSIDCKR